MLNTLCVVSVSDVVCFAYRSARCVGDSLAQATFDACKWTQQQVDYTTCWAVLMLFVGRSCVVVEQEEVEAEQTRR